MVGSGESRRPRFSLGPRLVPSSTACSAGKMDYGQGGWTVQATSGDSSHDARVGDELCRPARNKACGPSMSMSLGCSAAQPSESGTARKQWALLGLVPLRGSPASSCY